MKQWVLGAVLGPFLALSAQADVVTVFAAASMKGPLDAVAARFTAESGHEVVISYAGSNALAKHILDGAPAQIFISASREWMDALEAEAALHTGSRVDLLENSLVLIGHGAQAPVTVSADLDLKAMLGTGYLAMGMVDSVPAGQYGKAALESLGLWDAVAPQVAQSENVRAALALVAKGEAPYGLVYHTDAVGQPDVSVIGAFPKDSHPPITYPAALLGEAPGAAAEAFFEALSAAPADQTFRAAGFVVK